MTLTAQDDSASGSSDTPTFFEEIWIPCACLLVGNTLLFLAAQLKKDNSIIDIFWGLSFIYPLAILLVVSNNWTESSILVLVLVSIWGLRLAIHIGARHSQEDFRYQDMRASFMQYGTCVYYLLAYLGIFILQGVLALLVNFSCFYVALYSSPGFSWEVYLGLGVWLLGFFFETVGDWQLQQFRKDPSNRGKIIKSGLWRYTRHPNYFGDSVLWLGLYIVACSVPQGWTTLYSPVIMFLLLRFGSGVPLMEAKYRDRPEFQQYKKETNVFFPWFWSEAEALEEGPEKEKLLQNQNEVS